MAKYKCPSCGYTYDEVAGHDFEGFPPGTLWSAVPEEWSCPDCAVRDKADFELDGVSDGPAPAAIEAVKKEEKPKKAKVAKKPTEPAKAAPVKKAKPSAGSPTGQAYQKWICLTCGHIYEEEKGDPFEGVAPGTRFADVPDSWICPDCGTSKEDYILFEEE